MIRNAMLINAIPVQFVSRHRFFSGVFTDMVSVANFRQGATDLLKKMFDIIMHSGRLRLQLFGTQKLFPFLKKKIVIPFDAKNLKLPKSYAS